MYLQSNQLVVLGWSICGNVHPQKFDRKCGLDNFVNAGLQTQLGKMLSMNRPVRQLSSL